MSYNTPKFKPNTSVSFCTIQFINNKVTTLKDYIGKFNEVQGDLYRKNGNFVKVQEYKGTIKSLRWDSEEEEWIYSVDILSDTGETTFVDVPEKIITYDVETKNEFAFSLYKDYLWDEVDEQIKKIKYRCEKEIKEIKRVYDMFCNTIKE